MYHKETSQLICNADQLINFCLTGVLTEQNFEQVQINFVYNNSEPVWTVSDYSIMDVLVKKRGILKR